MGTVRHGHCVRDGKRTQAYHAWSSMKKRCRDLPKYAANYFNRGITVCPEWAARNGFDAFLRDMGEPPAARMSLDRIDNDKGYSPANCRWATYAEQIRNSRTPCWYEFGGRRMPQTDWERELGLSHGAIWHRLKKGWPLERALTERSHA